MVKLKRVYDPVSRADGTRFLVERLWPRGLSKERLHQTAWLKDVGPSTELRQWFNHDPLKWSQFRTRYFRELDSQPEKAMDDRCRASCVDWYGNARPLFLRGRVFALLGYEIVEGKLDDGRMSELRRVNYAPRG